MKETQSIQHPKKVHKHLVTVIAQALQDIFENSKQADRVVEINLKSHPKWGSRDRRFFAESIYEIVRWWRYLWWLSDHPETTELESLIRLWSHWWAWKYENVPEGFEDLVDLSRLKDRQLLPVSLEIKESIPTWLYKKGCEELGDLWDTTLSELNKPAHVFLRVNTLKIQTSSLVKQLLVEGIQCSVVSKEEPHTLVLAERKNLWMTKSFQQGLFEVQDRASQWVAPLLNPIAPMTVIDACAGAGGKSLHCASLMKNKGRIVAMDIHDWKLKELRQRSNRAGISIIETHCIEGENSLKKFYETADRLLLDVPCSGMGVLRRNPDTKWKLNQQELDRLRQIQYQILKTYPQMLKRGGQMVYSTCSVFPSENEKQVELFIKENPEYSLIKQKTFLPQENDWDGFYMALLEKN